MSFFFFIFSVSLLIIVGDDFGYKVKKIRKKNEGRKGISVCCVLLLLLLLLLSIYWHTVLLFNVVIELEGKVFLFMNGCVIYRDNKMGVALLPDAAAFGLLPRCPFVPRHPFIHRIPSSVSRGNRWVYGTELVLYVFFPLISCQVIWVVQSFPYPPYVIVICLFVCFFLPTLCTNIEVIALIFFVHLIAEIIIPLLTRGSSNQYTRFFHAR